MPGFDLAVDQGRRLLQSQAGSQQTSTHGGQFWTPIPQLRGSKLHAETHMIDEGLVEGHARSGVRATGNVLGVGHDVRVQEE